MRVGIDIRSAQFASGPRGSGRYIYNLVEGLTAVADKTEYVLLHLTEQPVAADWKELGPRVTLGGIEGPPTLGSRYPWYQSPDFLRYARVLPGIHWRSYYRRQAALFCRAVRSQNLQLVHFPTPFDPYVPPVPNCPAKRVYSFLDGIPLIFRDRFYDAWDVPARKLYDRQIVAFQSADRVIAISDASKEDAIGLFAIDPSKVETIYCGIPADLQGQVLESEVEAIRAKYRLVRPYFLFCSGAEWHKGFDIIVEALANLIKDSGKPFQLAVTGLHGTSTVDWIHALAFEHGLSSREIVITGFVNESDIKPLYKGALAVVSPSRYEGFGLPAGQAMTIGTPTIVSDRGSLPEIVDDAGIIVPLDDIDAWTAALSRMASEPGLRELYIELGKCRSSVFDNSKRALDVCNVYKGVCTGY